MEIKKDLNNGDRGRLKLLNRLKLLPLNLGFSRWVETGRKTKSDILKSFPNENIEPEEKSLTSSLKDRIPPRKLSAPSESGS